MSKFKVGDEVCRKDGLWNSLIVKYRMTVLKLDADYKDDIGKGLLQLKRELRNGLEESSHTFWQKEKDLKKIS